jgi:hypothetical protein
VVKWCWVRGSVWSLISPWWLTIDGHRGSSLEEAPEVTSDSE